MKTYFAARILVILIVLSISSPALAGSEKKGKREDIQGWRNAKWGMTEKEIEAAFPGEIERLKEPEDFGDWVASLTIKQLEIDGDKFQVWFQVGKKSGKLSQVLIKPLEKAALGIQFDNLERMLTDKYGPPSYNKDKKKEVGSQSREWKFPSTSIAIDYFTFGMDEVSDTLALRYTAARKEKNL